MTVASLEANFACDLDVTDTVCILVPSILVAYTVAMPVCVY